MHFKGLLKALGDSKDMKIELLHHNKDFWGKPKSARQKWLESLSGFLPAIGSIMLFWLFLDLWAFGKKGEAMILIPLHVVLTVAFTAILGVAFSYFQKRHQSRMRLVRVPGRHQRLKQVQKNRELHS